jgi:hypothetical protein
VDGDLLICLGFVFECCLDCMGHGAFVGHVLVVLLDM